MTDTSVRPAPQTWLIRPREAFTAEALRTRLIGSIQSWRDYPPSLRLWFWLIPTITAVIGGILRFVRLDDPHSLVFDETYYVKDAYSLLVSGYERSWPDKANDAFNAGNPNVLLNSPEYVVHPPVGKWMIAFGMWLFGSDNSFGWRFSAALTGTLSIFLIALIALKLFRSHILGAVAGLLLAVDGHHLVMSRTSLLDIFLMFWLLAAFGALLMDRDDGRRRLAARLAALAAASKDGRPTALHLASGPWLGFRWWRLAAGVCLGLAVGTKWSALFFVAGFGLMTVFWDMSARRIAGIRSWPSAGIIKDGIPAFLTMIPVAGAVYLSTWTGWFLSKDAYYRHWADTNPSATWGWIPGTVAFPCLLPCAGLQLPSGPQLAAPVFGESVDLARHGAPHVVLLRVPQAGNARLRPAQLHLGDSVRRQPRGLVGCHDRALCGPVLVGRTPRLAGGGHPGRASPRGTCPGSCTRSAPCSTSMRSPSSLSWSWPSSMDWAWCWAGVTLLRGAAAPACTWWALWLSLPCCCRRSSIRSGRRK